MGRAEVREARKPMKACGTGESLRVELGLRIKGCDFKMQMTFTTVPTLWSALGKMAAAPAVWQRGSPERSGCKKVRETEEQREWASTWDVRTHDEFWVRIKRVMWRSNTTGGDVAQRMLVQGTGKGIYLQRGWRVREWFQCYETGSSGGGEGCKTKMKTVREVIAHCGFDLHFSNNEWCWASFHVFVSRLYVFFGEMSV